MLRKEEKASVLSIYLDMTPSYSAKVTAICIQWGISLHNFKILMEDVKTRWSMSVTSLTL